jgi:MoxR-like ATPase
MGPLLLVTDDDGVLRALDFVDYEPRMQRLLRDHYGVVVLYGGAAPKSVIQALDALGVNMLGNRHAPDHLLQVENLLFRQDGLRFCQHVYAYAERLVRVTRPKTDEALDLSKRFLTWGAGPRAGLNLIMAAKARAMLNGQFYVSCDDVAAVALPIFRHRLIPNFAVQSESVTADDITRKILEAIPRDEKIK